MTTEAEILSRHLDDLNIARVACQKLRRNEIEAVPRGQPYMDLRDAMKRLENSCRQMFHWRGDDARWLRLGAVYARAQRSAQQHLWREQWAAFGEMQKLFELGLRRIDELGTRPTGRSIDKLILPGAIDRWFESRPLILQ